MTSPPSFFHALLRPSILQILRATGYHSTRPAVLDAVTDLAARYLALLCESTARHAGHNHEALGDLELEDVQHALEDAGALLPQRGFTEQMWKTKGESDEDLRGVEEFVQWFAGQKMKEMTNFLRETKDADPTDYLTALKRKHNQTGEDSKYHGTLLGKANDQGEVSVEGGAVTSINEWISFRSGRLLQERRGQNAGEIGEVDAAGDDGASSSALSSVGDRLDDEDEMDLEPPTMDGVDVDMAS